MRVIAFSPHVKGRDAVAEVLTAQGADAVAGQSRPAVLNWTWQAVRAGVTLLPFVFTALVVFRYAVVVPWMDQFEIVKIIQQSDAGTLTLGDFFAQHNEHRIFFPKLVMFGLAEITHWNMYYELGFSLLLALGTFGLLYQMIRRTLRERWPLWIGVLLTSVIVFSPIQAENWLWGFQLTWFLNIFGIVAAVWALASWNTSRPWLRVTVGLAGATLATYSLASGMFIWLAGVPLLLFQPKLRRWLLVWAAVAIAEITFYFSGLAGTRGMSQIPTLLDSKRSYVEYVAVFLTRPVVPSYDLTAALAAATILIGTLILASGYLYRYHRPEVVRLLPWLCLAFYAIIAAAMTGTSRVVLGVPQAYVSRYTTIAQFLLLANVMVWLTLWEVALRQSRRLLVLIPASVLAVIAALSLAGYPLGKTEMRGMRDGLAAARTCAHTVTNANDDCLLLLYPSKEIAWERLEYLRKIHWAGL
jgi:hypothetical protein